MLRTLSRWASSGRARHWRTRLQKLPRIPRQALARRFSSKACGEPPGRLGYPLHDGGAQHRLLPARREAGRPMADHSPGHLQQHAAPVRGLALEELQLAALPLTGRPARTPPGSIHLGPRLGGAPGRSARNQVAPGTDLPHPGSRAVPPVTAPSVTWSRTSRSGPVRCGSRGTWSRASQGDRITGTSASPCCGQLAIQAQRQCRRT